MRVRVRLWRKGHEGEPYSLVSERVVRVDELRELREKYDVEWVGDAE